MNMCYKSLAEQEENKKLKKLKKLKKDGGRIINV